MNQKCSGCGVSKTLSSFSKKQLKKLVTQRRCVCCTQETAAAPLSASLAPPPPPPPPPPHARDDDDIKKTPPPAAARASSSSGEHRSTKFKLDAMEVDEVDGEARGSRAAGVPRCLECAPPDRYTYMTAPWLAPASGCLALVVVLVRGCEIALPRTALRDAPLMTVGEARDRAVLAFYRKCVMRRVLLPPARQVRNAVKKKRASGAACFPPSPACRVQN